jgi:dihydrodipicolinate synthase/N-acetylneuraminate lyase
MLLEGLHIPLTTPFHPDGRLNLRKLAANVARYSKTPAAGLLVLGPPGEPSLCSDYDTHEVLRTAAEAAAPEKVLIAGIARDSVHATLALADYAAEQNYDAILVGVPSILALTSDASISITRLRELLTFFQALADRAPLPILLLSVQNRPIPVEAVVELAAHPRVLALLTALPRAADFDTFELLVQHTVASRHEVTVTHTFAPVTARMKKSAAHAIAPLISASTLSGTSTAVAEPPAAPAAPAAPALRTRTKTVGFQILAGRTEAMLDGLLVGAAGVVPAFAAAAPQACYEVYAAWKDSDRPLAIEKQERLRAAAALAEAGPAALKFAADLNGYFGGLPRLPHLPLTGVERAALEDAMKPLRS